MDLDCLSFINDKDFIKIKYNEETLLIKTPLLRVPFGIKSLKYKEKYSYNFQLSINKSFNEKSDKLLTFINKLELYIKNKYKDNTLFKDKTFISRIYEGKNSPLLMIDLKKETTFLCNNNFIKIESYIDKSFLCECSFIVTGLYIGETNWGLSFKCNEINIKEKTFKTFDFS